jgi:hypothetical protein
MASSFMFFPFPLSPTPTINLASESDPDNDGSDIDLSEFVLIFLLWPRFLFVSSIFLFFLGFLDLISLAILQLIFSLDLADLPLLTTCNPILISSDDEANPPAPAPLADQVQGQDQGQVQDDQPLFEPPAPANQEPAPPPMSQARQARIFRRNKAQKSLQRRRKISSALAKARLDLANATATIERAAYMLRDAFMCGCCGTYRANYTIHIHEQSGPHNMCNKCIHHFAYKVADLDTSWH